MKNSNTISIRKYSRQLLLLTTAVWGLLSCNKDFENKIQFGDDEPNLNIKGSQFRMAYIIVEGAVGSVVGNQATDYGVMPNLSEMTFNAMFSWNSVSAASPNDGTTYADLLTGVEKDKHKVTSTNLSGNNLAKYPSLFTRIKQYTKLRTALVTSNNTVEGIVNPADIDQNVKVNTDTEVLTGAQTELNHADAGLVVATFKDVKAAGDAYGYGPDSERYLEALHQFDQRLGELMKTIKSRPNYKDEKWLVIVASNNGGSYTLKPGLDDGSVFSKTDRNNFVLMYNNQFAYKLVERIETIDPAWSSSAVRYTGNSGFAAIAPADAKLYDLGTGADAGNYTVQIKLKVHEMNGKGGKAGSALNGVIVGKMNSAQNFPVGWSFTYNGGNGWRFVSNSSSSSNYAFDSAPFELDTWYTLTAKIYKDGTNRVVKLFRDGVLKQTLTNFAARNLSSPDMPLQLGYQKGSYGDNSGFVHSIADVRIYNAALPDNYIAANACTTLSTPQKDSYYANLIGYWPANDEGTQIKDLSPYKRNFVLNGSFVWNSFSERAGNLCPTVPDNLERYVIRTVDAPLMMYSWLGILEVSQFDLDAQSWSPIFSNK
ncbi:LamG-like jellyroll fold domain-containing protein [Sphingobacterium spiritivorum]|uniref:LamG-like jellyroll fold domain-containing protein n=1 Tax=Sphingobacterium spiritivorum TaxID=258 RepID=UPI003DA6B17D